MSNQKRKDHRDTIRRHLTQEVLKERKQKARRRKAEFERRGPRERDWSSYALEPEQEAPAFEPMKTRAAGEPPIAALARAPDGERADAAEAPEAPGPRAQVIGLGPGRALLRVDGLELEAQLAGEIARVQQSAISVGDRVRYRQRERALPLVEQVLPRRTTLSRPDPSDARRERVIAANIDLAVVVLAARSPRLRPRLIDRYRVAIEHGGAQALVCITKMDLVALDGERDEIEQLLAGHRARGLCCLTSSTESGEGLEELREQLAGRTSVFVGQSGTGKSSLVNALAAGGPRASPQAVGRVRTGDGKGRHTTTSSSLRELEGGIRVIDTPGIRGFGLWGVGPEELARAFPELARLAGDCRYSDCTHVVEPHCAVRAALEGGRLEPAHFEAFVRLRDSLEPEQA